MSRFFRLGRRARKGSKIDLLARLSTLISHELQIENGLHQISKYFLRARLGRLPHWGRPFRSYHPPPPRCRRHPSVSPVVSAATPPDPRRGLTRTPTGVPAPHPPKNQRATKKSNVPLPRPAEYASQLTLLGLFPRRGRSLSGISKRAAPTSRSHEPLPRAAPTGRSHGLLPRAAPPGCPNGAKCDSPGQRPGSGVRKNAEP